MSQITVQQRREKLTHDLGVLLRLEASVGLKSLGRRRGGIETLTSGGAMAERTAVVEKDEHITRRSCGRQDLSLCRGQERAWCDGGGRTQEVNERPSCFGAGTSETIIWP